MHLYSVPPRPTASQLNAALATTVSTCRRAQAAKRQTTGAGHSQRFSERAGYTSLQPALPEMRARVMAWIADAPHAYKTATGMQKKAFMTSSIKTYLSHIHYWYATTTGNDRYCLSRHIPITSLLAIITASFKSGYCHSQVHGITFEKLTATMAAASNHPPRHALILRAAFSFAFYAMLRPSEYMMTPRHSKFDPGRHLLPHFSQL